MGLKQELGLRKDFTNLEHETLLSIYYTAGMLQKDAASVLRQYGLTDTQFNVLSLLRHQCGDEGGLTQVELSRMLLVNRGNVTGLVDRMERDGLVCRKAVANDRRYNLVALTEKGCALIDSADNAYMDGVLQATKGLSAERLRKVCDALQVLRANIR